MDYVDDHTEPETGFATGFLALLIILIKQSTHSTVVLPRGSQDMSGPFCISKAVLQVCSQGFVSDGYFTRGEEACSLKKHAQVTINHEVMQSNNPKEMEFFLQTVYTQCAGKITHIYPRNRVTLRPAGE